MYVVFLLSDGREVEERGGGVGSFFVFFLFLFFFFLPAEAAKIVSSLHGQIDVSTMFSYIE